MKKEIVASDKKHKAEMEASDNRIRAVKEDIIVMDREEKKKWSQRYRSLKNVSREEWGRIIETIVIG